MKLTRFGWPNTKQLHELILRQARRQAMTHLVIQGSGDSFVDDLFKVICREHDNTYECCVPIISLYIVMLKRFDPN
jgi:hypothetical protein